MLNIVLVEPEIPQNCGNIARTCAATGAHLHLIKPLGFDISDRVVKRAGLDYWYLVDISVYENLADLFCKASRGGTRLLARHDQGTPGLLPGGIQGRLLALFGKETAGLPEPFRVAHYERCIRLPMRKEARSLNLSNSVAILTYEALRQTGFPGLKHEGEMLEKT